MRSEGKVNTIGTSKPLEVPVTIHPSPFFSAESILAVDDGFESFFAAMGSYRIVRRSAGVAPVTAAEQVLERCLLSKQLDCNKELVSDCLRVYEQIKHLGMLGMSWSHASSMFDGPALELLVDSELVSLVNGYDEKIVVADAFIEYWSLCCFCDASDPRAFLSTTSTTAASTTLSATRENVVMLNELVLLRPWLSLNGDLNSTFLRGVYSNLLATIANRPGISEVHGMRAREREMT